MRRKRFIMVVYTLSWIVAEKRYLVSLKKAQSKDKDKVQRMTGKELMKMQTNNSVPLKVRQFYIDQYYNMAKQAYKQQYKEYKKNVEEMKKTILKGSSRGNRDSEAARKAEIARVSLILVEEGKPVFQAMIDKTDLVQMIMDALRYRIKWAEIQRGIFFNSPALKKVAKAWSQRSGLGHVDLLQAFEQNHGASIVAGGKRKSLRRGAISLLNDYQQQKQSLSTAHFN